LTLVNLVQPGESRSGVALLSPERVESLQEQFGSEQNRLMTASEMAKKKLEQSGGGVVERILSVFREMVPANAVAAAVEMNLLGLICMAMVAGYFLPRLPERQRGVMVAFWEGVYELSMMTTGLVLKFAPWGIAALLATTVAENYASLAAEARFGELVSAILWFAAVTVMGLLLHAILVLPLLMLFFRIPPVRHFRAMIPQLITSFSTASSNASLPVTIDCVERRAGISPRISSFVLPLGATANMNGTALYECTAAIFVVQLFGYELDFARQFMVVLIALMTSIGVAGVPSASLVAIVVILQAVGRQIDAPIPLESGLAILLVFDRPLDMLRTSLNVFSDTVGAAVIAKSEGESVDYPDKPVEDPTELLPDQ
jgi:DAACS family dicarboxylate/amino acid:cation (Na+ or H+) symporter